VFVNRIDQIPRKYRTQAKIVLESTAPTGPQTEPASEPEQETPSAAAERGPATPVKSDDIGGAIRRAVAGGQVLRNAPAVACDMVDTRLLRAGTQPLTPSERNDLASMLTTTMVFASIAGVIALVVWVIILVGALRDGRPWWALLVFLVWPLTYVYLFVYAGKGRALFKTLCSLGLLSPALVALLAVWRFSTWFHAVVQARGGHF
jgi:hypothetical protein